MNNIVNSNKVEVYSIACVGAGIAGQSHIFDLVTLQHFELKGIVSKHLHSSKHIEIQYSLKNQYSNIEGILGDENLSLILIATPNNIAPDLVFKALEKNKKILVEKPFLLFLSHYHKIISAFPNADSSISILYNRRFKKAWKEAKEMLAQKDIGVIKSVAFNCSGPYKKRFSAVGTTFRNNKNESIGGVVIDTCSHLLDAILFLFGKIGEIKKATLKINPETELEYEAAIFINHFDQFEISIQIINSNSDLETKAIEIIGTKGKILIGDSTASFVTDTKTIEFKDEYIIRPVEDGLNLITGNPILGTKLSEARIIAEKINAIYDVAGYSIKNKWLIPRAKVLAKKSGAC